MAKIDLGRKINRSFNVPLYDHNDVSKEMRCRDLLNNLKSKGLHVAAMSLFCGDSQNFECSSCGEDQQIALSLDCFNLKRLFDEKLQQKSLKELRELVNTIFDQLPHDNTAIDSIEKYTREQKKSKWWMIFRVGRITASVLKEVCCTSVTKPSISLVKKICYPEQTYFSTPSTKYGEKHEEQAVKQLFASIVDIHTNLSWRQSGLIIPVEDTHLAASPDAIFECDCHGVITVEVKCPYSARQDTEIIDTLLKLKDPFISRDAQGNVVLNSYHKYYLQALMQIHVANAAFGYFYVWAPNQSLIFEVKKNYDYWNYFKTKATIFHKHVIIPELLAKHFTK